MILSFAATHWIQLFLTSVTVFLAIWSVLPLAHSIWHFCWMMRWLLLFTLLTHVLLSPGRTLWGVSWLSYDGLLSGVVVCVQMLLALVLSALLAITTTTSGLADTFGWFVQPLGWLGLRTGEWRKILLLALDFIPVVHAEIKVSGAPDDPDFLAAPPGKIAGRWSRWGERLHGLLLRLIERGDTIAHRVAAHEETSLAPVALAPLLPLALPDRLFLLAMALLLTACWVLA